MTIKGYKAFNKNLCSNIQYPEISQYEIGKIYEIDEKPKICERGFHFCSKISDCFNYYPLSNETRICEVEILGDIDAEACPPGKLPKKYCTNKIKIVKEISSPIIYTNNLGNNNTGGFNTGNNNTGSYNTGSENTGNNNTGYNNKGNWNTGSFNKGFKNTGDGNEGDYNTGDNNKGCGNVGNVNRGNSNTGNANAGTYNTGAHNKGWYNSGDWNYSNYNSGIFNTELCHKIRIFDKESNWDLGDWQRSKAKEILEDCPPYDGQQEWWNRLSAAEKKTIFDLPNFDSDKFKLCTGIDPGEYPKIEDYENWEDFFVRKENNNT